MIDELNLKYDCSGKTFINSLGREVSELDYFLVKLRNANSKSMGKIVLNQLDSNVSDHHPVQISVKVNKLILLKNKVQKSVKKFKVTWDKINQESFAEDMRKGLLMLKPNELKENQNIEVFAQNIMSVMKDTMNLHSTEIKHMNSKPKLKVWTQDIGIALRDKREAYKKWATEGKPQDPNSQLLSNVKTTKRLFRSSIRCEQARRTMQDRDKILNSRAQDPKTFHKLINKNRKNKNCFIEYLNVDGESFTGVDKVADGFKKHFKALAGHSENPNFDNEYHKTVIKECDHISDMVFETEVQPITPEELQRAIRGINRGKAPDYHGLSIECVINGGPILQNVILKLLNSIMLSGYVPECMKIGILTPIYKNKGSRNDACNFRGITVLPVIEKILEMVLKIRLVPTLEKDQSAFQRGFTAKTSPLHAALIVEEVSREYKDKGEDIDLVFLDAKAAFDVVDHHHLLRRLYHSGVNDRHWTIFKSIHMQSTSVVKWANSRSDPFEVLQGVRQGGITSTDLYKIYINPLLKRLEMAEEGCVIGDVRCNTSACADDVTLNSEKPGETSVLISMAETFANYERYILQPKKTEALKVVTSSRKEIVEEDFEIYGNKITNADICTHLGLKRSHTISSTAEQNVDNNIQKARRTVYSFMSSGFYGAGGLDVPSILHILKMHIIPILLYGLEIILPKKTQIDKLEIFQKRILKQLLVLPSSTPDIAIYSISGLLPVKIQIHKRALIMYNNVCLQSESAVERRIAVRQLTIKSNKSASWFVDIRKLFWLYELGDPEDLLESPTEKEHWKRTVNRTIDNIWLQQTIAESKTMKTLQNLNMNMVKPRKPHPLLQQQAVSTYDANRQLLKLKFMCGKYILQSDRASFSKNKVDDTCRVCYKSPETLQHMVLECSGLSAVRDPILRDIESEIEKSFPCLWQSYTQDQKVTALIDCTVLYKKHKLSKVECQRLHKIDFQCRRLFFTLHTKRFKIFELSKGAASARPLNTISKSVCSGNSAGNLLITKKPDGCYNSVDPLGSSRL